MEPKHSLFLEDIRIFWGYTFAYAPSLTPFAPAHPQTLNHGQNFHLVLSREKGFRGLRVKGLRFRASVAPREPFKDGL